jgi:hypothetical protein
MKNTVLGTLAAAGIGLVSLPLALAAEDNATEKKAAAAPEAKYVRLTVVTAEGGG